MQNNFPDNQKADFMNNSYISQSIKFLVGAVAVSAISFPIYASAATTFATGLISPIGLIPSPPQAVPEPFTIIGTIIGGAAAFQMKKKLKGKDS